MASSHVHLRSKRISCLLAHQQFRTLCGAENKPRIAIVGSGPAGFYAARSLRRLLNQSSGGFIDIFEKSPLPYGLVRYGVAPDHPEVKNCIHQFEDVFTADSKNNVRCRFFGNVNIGSDLPIPDLQSRYDATLLAYGAQNATALNIPGADEGVTPNYFTSQTFVNWYNGGITGPDEIETGPDLTATDSAIVLGHGNVALDIGRVLLTPVDKLRETDITERALEKLRKSKIKRVILVGRRGPLQVGFTIKEVREFVNLPHVLSDLNPAEFGAISPSVIEMLPRPKKRLVKLMSEAAERLRFTSSDYAKSWHIKFLRSPLEIMRDPLTSFPRAVRFAVNELQNVGSSGSYLDLMAVPTGVEEVLEAGLVVSAIGYRSQHIDPTVPLDRKKDLVLTDSAGRVPGTPGLYACGWCATGPTGVLADTSSSAAAIARTIAHDLKENPLHRKTRKMDVAELLAQRGVRAVTWRKWREIDALEVETGDKVGKPREKIVHLSEILSLL